jgi:hypothetical protein
MNVQQASAATVTDLWSRVEAQAAAAGFLEEAAQALAAALYAQFKESLVLARLFVTVPFAELPKANQEFVRRLAEDAEGPADLKPTTPVLSLVGTCGTQADWRDRRRSKGHVGIPIVSSSFVGAIPMVSRLLKELGVPVEWVDSHDSAVIVNAIGSTAGLFFVENAATARDAEGRSVISPDFVSQHSVASVFGVGGAYSTGQIAVITAFCRSQFARSVAERFLALATFFISKTAQLAESGRIFRN